MKHSGLYFKSLLLVPPLRRPGREKRRPGSQFGGSNFDVGIREGVGLARRDGEELARDGESEGHRRYLGVEKNGWQVSGGWHGS